MSYNERVAAESYMDSLLADADAAAEYNYWLEEIEAELDEAYNDHLAEYASDYCEDDETDDPVSYLVCHGCCGTGGDTLVCFSCKGTGVGTGLGM